MLYFSYFIWKWTEFFENFHFFYFWKEAILLLNPFNMGNSLKIWHLKEKKKKLTLKSLISTARANSESKLTLSESSFNFLKNRVVFCELYPPGYSVVLLPPTRRAQRVNDQAVKDLNLLFFIYFIWKWGETLHFFTFRPKQCFYLTHSAREYFVKLAFKKKQKIQL